MTIYQTPTRPDELYHHGIKGMHWGIRRFQPYPNGSKRKGKEIGQAKRKMSSRKKTSSSSKTSTKPKEDLSKLSDEEIQKRINRLALEKRYQDAMKQPVSSINNGTAKHGKAKEYVKKKLAYAGDRLVDSLIQKGTNYAAEKILTKALSDYKPAKKDKNN